jgi:hypothetical protein
MTKTVFLCCSRVLVVAVLSLVSRAGFAEDTVRASELKSRADIAMDRGAYSEALTQYREAYAAAPSAPLLYNMGRAEEKLGNYHEALISLEAFEDTASPDLKAKVPRLAALIERLRSRVARVAIRTPVRGAVVLVAGEPRTATPMLRPLPVAPGPTRIEVRANGYATYRREVHAEQGKVTVVDVHLVPATSSTALTFADAPARDAVRSEPITKKWWFWTGVGVVVAAGAAGTVAILTTERAAPRGDIEPRQVAAPLLRF